MMGEQILKNTVSLTFLSYSSTQGLSGDIDIKDLSAYTDFNNFPFSQCIPAASDLGPESLMTHMQFGSQPLLSPPQVSSDTHCRTSTGQSSEL